MIINQFTCSIELTKAEEKAARVYGSVMYENLVNARRDFPTFRVVVKKTTRRKSEYDGLTYSYMEKYIKNKDEAILDEFLTLIGKNNDENDENRVVASYLEVKKWFVGKFPEIAKAREEKKKRIQAILDSVA